MRAKRKLSDPPDELLAGLDGALAAEADAIEPQTVAADAIPAEATYYSLGYVCWVLQQTPEIVRRLMQMAGVKFACQLNNIPHLDHAGLKLVAAKQSAVYGSDAFRLKLQKLAANAPYN